MIFARWIAAFACAAAAAGAAAQVPNTFTAGTAARAAEVNANFEYLDQRLPRLFFTQKCMTPNCQITKVNTAETDRQVMGALALPRGDYLVVAKANAYLSTGGAVPGLSAIRIQCMLFDPAVPASADFSTCAPVGNVSWNDAHMTMQLPASITAAEGGQVQVACRADIPQVGIDAGASAWVWDVAISATRVASVTAD